MKLCSFLSMENMLESMLAILTLWATFSSEFVSAAPDHLDLIILHNNDVHGKFEEINKKATGTCTPEDIKANERYGGFARISHIVKHYRNEAKKTGSPSVLYFNAGDIYVGSLWFAVFMDKVCSDFMNMLMPDAMALGNHEFDFGTDALVPFLKDIQFPMLFANFKNPSNYALRKIKSVKPYIVREIDGFQVGIIGYLTPETKDGTLYCDVDFTPEIPTINEIAEGLQKKGVNIIIALGHSGYTMDQEIARNCPLVDVVIGGHSHTFLHSGKQTGEKFEGDEIVGPYPTIVTQSSGKQVPVVQAYVSGKYLGKLELKFDKNGNLVQWGGNPILLDASIQQDPEILALEAKYRKKLDRMRGVTIGQSQVFLDCFGCRYKECVFGNLIADSFVYAVKNQKNAPFISLITSGSIRSPINAGKISVIDLQNTFPYKADLLITSISGMKLWEAIEHSVAEFIEHKSIGKFLQMSGLRVVFDVSKPSGKRVESINVLQSKGGTYGTLDQHRNYDIIITSFLYEGGDGFTMFKESKPRLTGMTVLEAVQKYIQDVKTLNPVFDGRITVRHDSIHTEPDSITEKNIKLEVGESSKNVKRK